MQPLISPIDHESRHNSYRAEHDSRASEETPLLHRFPQSEIREPGDRATTFVVSLLLIILIAGVIIGIYLLVVQSNSENVLPPVEMPLQLVSETQWNPGSVRRRVLEDVPYIARHVVVVQTDSPPCHDTRACAQLLTILQTNASQGLPYNFLVSSDGHTFEALGWRRPSPMFPEYHSPLVLAFIGNFIEVSPTRAQLDEARDFMAESVSLRQLAPAYTIVGRTQKYTPKYLFIALSKLPQWSSSLSDAY